MLLNACVTPVVVLALIITFALSAWSLPLASVLALALVGVGVGVGVDVAVVSRMKSTLVVTWM